MINKIKTSSINGLKIFILLTSIFYQIWLIFTVSFIILYENLNFELPNSIIDYIKCISGFVNKPWEIPYLVLFLFILGGVCMGVTLGLKAIKTFENWYALIAQRMNIKMMKKDLRGSGIRSE
jgi:hypothetical protein